MIKTIVFDVDGVITDSWIRKDKIIQEVLDKHWLLHLSWVRQILERWLNRVLILDEISKIKPFDINLVLQDINTSLLNLESSMLLIDDTLTFIRENFERYHFFTNTSMPKSKLQRIFSEKDIARYFMELLAYDDGSKKENIEYIIKVYDVKPEEILFIDDKMCHIDAVKNTWVHTLLFAQDGVSLEHKINSKLNT